MSAAIEPSDWIPVCPASVMSFDCGRMGVMQSWEYVGGGVGTFGGLDASGLEGAEAMLI